MFLPVIWFVPGLDGSFCSPVAIFSEGPKRTFDSKFLLWPDEQNLKGRNLVNGFLGFPSSGLPTFLRAGDFDATRFPEQRVFRLQRGHNSEPQATRH